MGIRLNVALSNQAAKKGTRVGRWESTRSITTFRGQGRKTVREASKIMASSAHQSCLRNGRSSGKKWGSHRLVLIPDRRFFKSLFMNVFSGFGRFVHSREFHVPAAILEFHE